jgi:hypothetical protein
MAESIILTLLNNVIGIGQALAPQGVDSITFFITFFLIFAITYVTAGLVPIFRDDKEKKINKNAIRIVIALAIAYFSATTPMVTTSIEKVFPSMGVILIGAVAFMFTIYFIFPDPSTAENAIKFILGPIVVGAILLIAWGAIVQWETPLFTTTPDGIILAGLLITHYDIALILLIIGIAIFIILNMKTSDRKPIHGLIADAIGKQLR